MYSEFLKLLWEQRGRNSENELSASPFSQNGFILDAFVMTARITALEE